MRIVVSDTSPIRALLHLNLLHLLRDIFGQVTIPPAVHSELQHASPDCFQLAQHLPPYLVVEAPKDQGTVRQLAKDLEDGEAQAIALALEADEALILMD